MTILLLAGWMGTGAHAEKSANPVDNQEPLEANSPEELGSREQRTAVGRPKKKKRPSASRALKIPESTFTEQIPGPITKDSKEDKKQ